MIGGSGGLAGLVGSLEAIVVEGRVCVEIVTLTFATMIELTGKAPAVHGSESPSVDDPPCLT